MFSTYSFSDFTNYKLYKPSSCLNSTTCVLDLLLSKTLLFALPRNKFNKIIVTNTRVYNCKTAANWRFLLYTRSGKYN